MTIMKKIKPKVQWIASRRQWRVYGHGSIVYHGSGSEAYRRWELHQQALRRKAA